MESNAMLALLFGPTIEKSITKTSLFVGGDQQLNSRFVEEVWKLGLDMKDVSDRRVVEQMVNDLMVE
ncbi:hypothetical protein Gotur_020416 [Gossypium turneri]